MKRLYCFVLLVIGGANVALANPPKKVDPRYLPISASELVSAIQKAPKDSPVNEILLCRAGESQLSDVAYKAYKSLWQQESGDGYRTLWYGMATVSHRSAVDGPFHHGRQAEWNALSSEADVALAKAANQLPNDATAQLAYGFQLWQYGSKMKEGLHRMRKAEAIAPRNPYVHVRLGFVYMNPTGNAFSLQNAEKEFQQAISLDPTYASPYNGLTALYLQKGQKQKASHQLEEYLRFVPAADEQKPQIRFLRDSIAALPDETKS